MRTMTKIVLSVLGVLATTSVLYADGCTTQMFVNPRTGQAQVCQQCCYAGVCQLICDHEQGEPVEGADFTDTGVGCIDDCLEPAKE